MTSHLFTEAIAGAKWSFYLSPDELPEKCEVHESDHTVWIDKKVPVHDWPILMIGVIEKIYRSQRLLIAVPWASPAFVATLPVQTSPDLHS